MFRQSCPPVRRGSFHLPPVKQTLQVSLTPPSADPTHVIGLYPDLLPSDYRKQLHYPNPLPTLSGAELEKAHLALIDYLTQVCVCLCVCVDKTLCLKPIRSR